MHDEQTDLFIIMMRYWTTKDTTGHGKDDYTVDWRDSTGDSHYMRFQQTFLRIHSFIFNIMKSIHIPPQLNFKACFSKLTRKCDADDKLNTKECWPQFDIKMIYCLPFYEFSLDVVIRRNTTPTYNTSPVFCLSFWLGKEVWQFSIQTFNKFPTCKCIITDSYSRRITCKESAWQHAFLLVNIICRFYKINMQINKTNKIC